MSDWTIEPKTPEQTHLYMQGYRVVHAATGYYEARAGDGRIVAITRNAWECWLACQSDAQPAVTQTDCRTDEGISVGLVDAIITIIRTLRERNPEHTPAFAEAIKDLASDEDFIWLKDLAQ